MVEEVLQVSWESWRWRVQWLTIGSWQKPVERIINVDPLTTTQEIDELDINHSTVVQHLKQSGKVKKLDKGCFVSWPQIKNLLFWSVIFSYSAQQWTISQSDCDVQQKVDFVWQPVTTSSVVGPRKSSRALPKAKLAPQKAMVTVWWPTASLMHYSFLNSSKTITSEKYAQQVNKMDHKLQCLHPVLVNRMGLILHDNTQLFVAQPMLQKWNKLGYKILPYLPYSPCYRDWSHSAYFRIRQWIWDMRCWGKKFDSNTRRWHTNISK